MIEHPDEEPGWIDRREELGSFIFPSLVSAHTNVITNAEPELEKIWSAAFPSIPCPRKATIKTKKPKSKSTKEVIKLRKTCALCNWTVSGKSPDNRLFHALKAHPGKPESALACKLCDFKAVWALSSLKIHHSDAHPNQPLSYFDHREKVKDLIQRKLFYATE